jgi:hypothetical protein
MNRKVKTIEVITGEKSEGDVDPTRAIEGTSRPRLHNAETEGRSCHNQLMFECAWCGAINYTEQKRTSCLYVCFVCGKAMNPGFE